MLYTSKESSEHVKCRFRLKKYDLLLKKWKKNFEKKNCDLHITLARVHPVQISSHLDY